VLVLAVFGMFVSVLVTNGLISSEIGVDATGAGPDGPDTGVPAVISNGGPVIDLTAGRTQSSQLPPKTVALTFDDGPDPVWTPQVLAVLARYHVPGTFFVVGSRVAHYPQLVRDIRASGSEIGLHTFTHPELREVSPTRVDQEFTATQLALAGATGQLSYVVRPPYSSEASAVDDAGFAVMQRLGQEGYVTTLVDTDSNDWQLPGVDDIVNAVLPVAATGGIVLLHDAGGNRAQTVAALDRIIPQLQAQGVRFTTVSAGAGLPAADFPADRTQLLMGRVMLDAVAVAAAVVAALEWSLLVGGGLVLLRLVVMTAVALRHGRRSRRRVARRPALARPPGPVSVVVPAFNEAATIVSTVRSLVASEHPVEVVVVDDGFNIDRRVQDAWGVVTTVPGAIGAYRREALVDVGGVSDDTLAEDTDLTIALGRAGWRVVYEPAARAWTDAPSSFAQLWRQRYRWSYGIMQSLWKHRHAVVERGRSGHVGRVGLLLTGLFQVLLPLLAPMVDVYLVYGLVYLDPVRTATIWGAALLLQLAAGVVAFRLEREPLSGLVLLPLQQIVYRQLMYAVLIQSVASAVAGTRLGWQKIPRAGLFSAAPAQEAR